MGGGLFNLSRISLPLLPTPGSIGAMVKRTSRKSSRTATKVFGLERRLRAFVVEQFPFAASAVADSLAGLLDTVRTARPDTAASIDALRSPVRETLVERLDASLSDRPDGEIETTPGVTLAQRLATARDELLDAVDGWLRRESITASFTVDERREMLRGMVLTRATDNQLKQFFLGGQVRYIRVPNIKAISG
jgi:hypothetical protein